MWRAVTAGGTPAIPKELLGLGWGSVGGPEVLGHAWLSRCLPVSACRGSSLARSWGEVCLALPGGPGAIGGARAIGVLTRLSPHESVGSVVSDLGLLVAVGQGEPGPLHAVPPTTLGPGHPWRSPLGMVCAWLVAGRLWGPVDPHTQGRGG